MRILENIHTTIIYENHNFLKEFKEKRKKLTKKRHNILKSIHIKFYKGETMRKSKFVQSTVILIIGGFITKLLGMVIKIVMTRLMGTEGIGVYMLLMPTFSLLIALAQLGFPVAISKLVAEDKNNKNLVFSIIPISLLLNICIMVLLLFFANAISTHLLHESRTTLGIICIGFVLPFISISSILRGYFFGKERMIPHVVSNVTEDIIRLITLIIGIPIFIIRGIEFAVAFIVISNILSELTSILVLFLFLPKNFKLHKKDFVPKNNIIDILNISIPTTGSRIIGNIGYFLEPIILTFVLLRSGYQQSFIVTEYGIISGYIMPLLLLPSFFTMAISQALIPVISKSYANHHYEYAKAKIKQAIFFSLLIGIPVTILFILFPSSPLKLIYNTTEGISYLRVLAPICLLHYIQSPLTSSLQAMGKAKEAMNGTILGVIIRTVTLFIGCSLKIGMWGLVLATSLNIILVTYHQAKHVNKAFILK